MTYSTWPLGGRCKHWAMTAVVAIAWMVSLANSAQAIPSPELVIGTLSSVSQVFAVLTALLGGGAVAAGIGAAGRQSNRARVSGWLAGAFGLAALLSLAGNVYQRTTAEASRTERLEATLLRPAARGTDGKLLDPDLREMSFERQARRPMGMSTDDAARLLTTSQQRTRAGNGFALYDIRESAEAEMGTLPGAEKVRFPDIDANAIQARGETALLFCHNGNRSGETCAKLSERGIDCRFIVGGLEKWLAEGRALGPGGARSLADLRALPDFPNNRTLLDTDQVKHLVQTAGAIFVDVRYPGEYESGHLDGAINLPIRPLPTAELARRLDALPHRPVIAPCYDRRSCFFGEILGLELTRRGRDFRGRYTVPWEYFSPPPRPPYVEKLLAAQSGGWWSRAAGGLSEFVEGIAAVAGFPAAILALALLSRLLVLPFSLKAERDQRVARCISPEIARFKSDLAHDRVRLARALQQSYSKNGLTPGRNLIALAFLPLMALSVEAVSRAAERTRLPFLWMPDLSAADPFYLLPVVFGALAVIYMSLSLASRRLHHVLIWAGAGPLLAAAVALLPAAAGLYIVSSMALLLLQRWLASGGIRAVARHMGGVVRAMTQWRLTHPGLITLDETDRLSDVGNKALRLGEMRALGLPVPPGIVLSHAFLSELPAMPARRRESALVSVWRRLDAATVAVRSSAVGEDGPQRSFAGVFETKLDVDKAGFAQAVAAVADSFSDPRVSPYGAGPVSGNVLVQPMVRARYAGVLFTEDPSSAGASLLEFVEGSGEALVSGRAAPASCRYGRISGARLSGTPPPFDPAPLLAQASRIERHYGVAQDIEWAFADRRFVVLQSRDITAFAENEAGIVRAEWRRLLSMAAHAPLGEVILSQTEMSELLPRPTMASLSLIEAVWKPGGSVDLAARRLGVGYAAPEDGPPLHTTVLGRLYTDLRSSRARGLSINGLAARRLRAGDRDIERHFRSNVVPVVVAQQRRAEAMDYDRLPPHDLLRELEAIRTRFIVETYVEAEVVNIAAGFYVEEAQKAAPTGRLDAGVAATGSTAEQQAIRTALLAPPHRRNVALMRAIGHRAPLDYELSQPRHSENPGKIEAIAKTMLSNDWDRPHDEIDAGSKEPGSAAARDAVERSRRFEILKEDAKHHVLRELAELRRVMIAIDKRFGLQGQVFDLTLDEIAGIDVRAPESSRTLAAQRHETRAVLGALPSMARRLTPRDIEFAAAGVADVGRAEKRGRLQGTRVSGHGAVEGSAYAVSAADAEAAADLDTFKDGDILVSRMIPPAWLPYVLRSGGVVTEVGGWLSHMAIVARERGIVMIVGCDGLDEIATGAALRLHLDGRVEPVSRDAEGLRSLAAE